MQIRDFTEDALIKELVQRLPKANNIVVPSGDDCAVFDFPKQTAVSIDLLVEDQHFRRDWSTPQDVGYRAVMQNLADAVAMGATPASLVIGLVLPRNLDAQWLFGFADGVCEACAPFGVGVDGGDLTAGDKIVISITVLAKVFNPVLRSGAQVGDLIVHTGQLGWSRAGMEMLLNGFGRENSGDNVRFVEAFLRPTPPLKTVLAATKNGTLNALMDVSDGLMRDAKRMAKSSEVIFNFSLSALQPYISQLATVPNNLAQTWVLTGGEDHGFLATISPDKVVPVGFTVLGEVTGKSTNGEVMLDNKPFLDGGGWDHFSHK